MVGLKEDEDDENTASQLIKLVGKSGTSVEDIRTITRMGKKKEGKTRDLLVQFVTKQKRDAFYAVRKNTPKDEENKKVYINEDLTESNYFMMLGEWFGEKSYMAHGVKMEALWSK